MDKRSMLLRVFPMSLLALIFLRVTELCFLNREKFEILVNLKVRIPSSCSFSFYKSLWAIVPPPPKFKWMFVKTSKTLPGTLILLRNSKKWSHDDFLILQNLSCVVLKENNS